MIPKRVTVEVAAAVQEIVEHIHVVVVDRRAFGRAGFRRKRVAAVVVVVDYDDGGGRFLFTGHHFAFGRRWDGARRFGRHEGGRR